MQCLKNQDNEFNISRLGLGCMRMSMLDGTENSKESIATIHAALDAGINFLNTGDFYGTGHNEMLVGEQLKVTAETKSLFLSSLGDWLLQMACLTV